MLIKEYRIIMPMTSQECEFNRFPGPALSRIARV